MIIQFTTQHQAFVDDYKSEISRILKKIDNDIKNGFTSNTIMDINGNKVGNWSLNRNDLTHENI